MDLSPYATPRNIAALGILGALGFALLWAAAVAVDGSWVFGEMTLSELGDPERPADAIFNAACILAGAVLAIYSYGMRGQLEGRWLQGSMSLAMLAAIFLIGVGLFPIHVEFWHTFFSWAFFLTMMGAIIVSIPGDWERAGRARNIAVTSLMLILIATSLLGFTALALAEAVAVIFIMAWVVIRSLDLVL